MSNSAAEVQSSLAAAERARRMGDRAGEARALDAALAAEACLLATAGRGGELVYRHGVGVVSGPQEKS